MTVSTTNSRQRFAGDGVTTVLTTTFAFLDASSVRVTSIDDTTGVETVKTISTHYTVSGGSGSTGAVTMLTPPPAGTTTVVERVQPQTQPLALSKFGALPSPDLERAYDRLTLALQDLSDQVDRSIKFPIADSILPALAKASLRANGLLGFDANGQLALTTGGATDTLISSAMTPVVQAASLLAGRDALGVEIGADVQSWNAKLDTLAALASVANLSALAGLTGAADRIPAFTGAGAMSAFELSQSVKTWTPTILGSSGNPTITYSNQVGLYVRIGTLCIVWGFISTSAYSGGSGNFRIGNLPFTVSPSVNPVGYIPQWETINLSAGCVNLSAIPSSSSTFMVVNESFDNAGASSLGVGQWGSTSNMYFSAMFAV